MINYSFIIPHHNSPDLLNRCLDSIPQREDIEIIVVDDNSDADKRPRVSRPDVKLICIDAEHTKGAGRARNYGLAAAAGRWVLFIDCDDFYEQDFIDYLDPYVDSKYDIIIFDAYWNYNVINKTGKRALENRIKKYLENPHDTNALMWVKHSTNVCWNKMYRLRYLQDIDVHFEEVPRCNDGWFTHFTCGHTDNVKVLDLPLYYYVKTQSGITLHKSSLEDRLQLARTGAHIKRYLESIGAGKCFSPFWHGFKWTYQQNGLIQTLIIYCYKFYCYKLKTVRL